MRRKFANVRGGNLLAMLMVALIFVGSAFQVRVRTALGQQCPTAAVQLVTVAVKDCCGKVVGYAERAPKPGEALFVQCRCAEKKAAEHQAVTSPKLHLLPGTATDAPQPQALADTSANPTYRASKADRSTPPSLRPPATC